MKYFIPDSWLSMRRSWLAAITYSASESASKPRKRTMRSLADAMITPPEADISISA